MFSVRGAIVPVKPCAANIDSSGRARGVVPVSNPSSDPENQDVVKSQEVVPRPESDERRTRLFEERYGVGAFEELSRLFGQPCVTYAQIAQRFGVTRERVRQWHLSLSPDSPRGHERRRLCQAQQQRRRLLEDPVYRAFVRAARTQFPNASVQPVLSKTALRKRVVRFGQWVIALKRAGTARRRPGATDAVSYSLTGSRSSVDFFFFHLHDDAFVLVPASMVPRTGTTFLDSPTSKYRAFKNVFQLPVHEGSTVADPTVVSPDTQALHVVGRHDDDHRRIDTRPTDGGEWCHCGKP
ncbi:MAG: hypothetical protein ABMA15_12855 [Vicinamibacterales bacterium]